MEHEQQQQQQQQQQHNNSNSINIDNNSNNNISSSNISNTNKYSLKDFNIYYKKNHLQCPLPKRRQCNDRKSGEPKNSLFLHPPEALEVLEVAHTTDLVPGLVRQPGRVGIGQFVLKPHPSGEEEHVLLMIQIVSSSDWMAMTSGRGDELFSNGIFDF